MFGRHRKINEVQASVLEELEPRLLYSADPLGFALADVFNPDSGQKNDQVEQGLPALSVADTDEYQSTTRTEVVFVSSSLPDYQVLLEELRSGQNPNTSIAVYLVPDSDSGVELVTETLASYSDLEAVHFITHGSDSGLYLGSDLITGNSVAGLEPVIAGWGEAMATSGDLLFYGCDLAQSEHGRAMLDSIAKFSGADVAASADTTGHSSRDGDWDMEYNNGQVETRQIVGSDAMLQWDATLAVLDITSTVDELDPGNGVTSLREAIRDANPFDIIQLQDATYNISLPGGDDSSGDYDIYKSMTIRGVPGGNTTIDANGLHRVLHVNLAGITVVLQDVTITGGSADTFVGGGIMVERGTLELVRVNVEGNETRTDEGGGIFVDPAGTLIAADSSISNNTAGTDNREHGGGLYNDGVAQLQRVNIDNNLGKSGGGIYNDGILQISHSSLSGNNASVQGGGIRNIDILTEIDSVSFIGNSADNGGGLFLDTDIDIINSTFSGNTAVTSDGGAIGVAGSPDINIVSSTFVDNTANRDGGALAVNGGATVTLQNSLFDGNSASGAPEAISGNVVSLGFNLVEDPGFGDSDGLTDIVGVDAGVGLLGDNGGYGQTHALLPGSPAIDSGGGTPGTDQTGVAQNEIPDIGAYEFRSSTSDGALYWTSLDERAIYRGNADSTNPLAYQKIVDTLTVPYDIEVDLVNGKIYWVEAIAAAGYGEQGGLGGIVVADLDGTNRTALVVGLEFPTGLALDIDQGFIYVTTNNNSLTPLAPAENQILRYNLDGSFSRVIAQAVDTAVSPDRMLAPTDVEYDANSNRLFWSDRGVATPEGREIKVVDLPPVGDPGGVLSVPVQFHAGPYTNTQFPHGLVVLPGGDAVYFASGEGLRFVNPTTATDTYSGDISVGGGLYGVAYGDVNNTLYFTDASGRVQTASADLTSNSTLFSGMGVLGGIAVAPLNLVSQLPQLLLNTGTTVDEGSSITLSSSMLDATDPEDGLAVQYRVTATPGAGIGGLARDGVTLATGDTFTQADINANRIVYSHSGGEESADSFEFEVTDGTTSLPVETFNFTISAVNDAPAASSGTLVSIAEDTLVPGGASLASLFGSSFSDPDPGASFAGVAVVSNPNDAAQGTWQYSVDGSSWSEIGLVFDVTALKLSAATLVRFVPATDFSGPVSGLGMRVLDNTHTQPFSTASIPSIGGVSVNGGSTSISGTVVLLSTTVTTVNDAPVGQPTMLSAVVEDATNPAGENISTLFGPGFSDVDAADSLAGVAVVSNPLDATQGRWQYSVDGSNWKDVSAVSTNNALMLDDSTRLRFLPASNYAGTVTPLSAHVLDDSIATAFTTSSLRVAADVSVKGAATPISGAAIDLGSSITAVNDSPSIADAVLPAVPENTVAPAGQSVEQLFQPSYSDPDSGPLIGGIAIVSNPQVAGDGFWSYSTDAGANWYRVAIVSENEGLLLDRTSMLRFVPAAGFSGVPVALGVHALDSDYSGTYSSGLTRQTIDVTAMPLNPSASVDSASLSTVVGAVSHAPEGLDAMLVAIEDTPLVIDANSFRFTDALDGDALHSVEIVTLPASGDLSYAGTAVSAGQVFTRAELESAQLVFQAPTNASGVAYTSFTFRVTDDGSLADGGVITDQTPNTLTIDITPVNDSPGSITLDNLQINENVDAVTVGAVNATDPDPGDSLLFAVDDSRFEVTGGILKLRAGQFIDYETEKSIPLTLTATDQSGQSAQDSFVLQVQNVNEAPQLVSAPAPQSGTAPWTFSLPADMFTDADGDTLSYSATQSNGQPLPGWITFNPDSLQFAVADNEADTEALDITVTVNDGNGATASSVVSISIAPPLAPVEPGPEPELVVPEPEPELIINTPPDTTEVEIVPLEPEPPVTEAPPQNTLEPEFVEVQEQTKSSPLIEEVELQADNQGGYTVSRNSESDVRIEKTVSTQANDTAERIHDLNTTPMTQLFDISDDETVALYANLRELLDEEWAETEYDPQFSRKVIGTTVTVSSGLSIGYVLWLVRSGTLIGSVLSTLPAWRFIDPLPILDSLGDSESEDGETLESIVSENTEPDSDDPADSAKNQD